MSEEANTIPMEMNLASFRWRKRVVFGVAPLFAVSISVFALGIATILNNEWRIGLFMLFLSGAIAASGMVVYEFANIRYSTHKKALDALYGIAS